MNQWLKRLGIIGGLVTVLFTGVSGLWKIGEMLWQGAEAYAQVRDLKESTRSIEKRLDNSIDRQWKMYKLEQRKRTTTTTTLPPQ
jgi:hypothetical protein